MPTTNTTISPNMRKFRDVAIAAFFVFVASRAPLAAETAAHRCEQGVWDIVTHGKTLDGEEYVSAATSTRYCVFSGALEMDEYRALSPQGDIVFIGASFNYWSDDGRTVKTLWVMGGDPGYTLIDGVLKDNRLTASGIGIDFGGAFSERSVMTLIGERDYRFRMDRSYDGGSHWIEDFSVLDATFRSSAVPDLPKELHPLVQQAKAVAKAPRPGIAVMDGFAEIEEIEDQTSTAGGRTLRFSSRYMGPDRWRSVYWQIGDDAIKELETVIESSGAAVGRE